jgi:hypothetical protein
MNKTYLMCKHFNLTSKLGFEIFTVVIVNLLECDVVLSGRSPLSRSGLLLVRFSLGLRSYPDDGGSKCLRNISKLLPDSTALHPTRYYYAGFLK